MWWSCAPSKIMNMVHLKYWICDHIKPLIRCKLKICTFVGTFTLNSNKKTAVEMKSIVNRSYQIYSKLWPNRLIWIGYDSIFHCDFEQWVKPRHKAYRQTNDNNEHRSLLFYLSKLTSLQDWICNCIFIFSTLFVFIF